MSRTLVSGFTLLEMMVSGSIFLLLLAALFSIYVTGANAWIKADANSALLGKAQSLTGRVARELERSNYLSFNPVGPRKDTFGNPVPSSPSPGAAFLTAVDANGVFQFDFYTRRPRWQRYLIYYHSTSDKTVRLAERSVLGTSTERNPRTLEQFTGMALSSSFSGGQPLLTDVDSLTFQVLPQEIVDLEDFNLRVEMVLKVSQEVRGQTVPRTLESRTHIRFRN